MSVPSFLHKESDSKALYTMDTFTANENPSIWDSQRAIRENYVMIYTGFQDYNSKSSHSQPGPVVYETELIYIILNSVSLNTSGLWSTSSSSLYCVTACVVRFGCACDKLKNSNRIIFAVVKTAYCALNCLWGQKQHSAMTLPQTRAHLLLYYLHTSCHKGSPRVQSYHHRTDFWW